MYSYIDALRGLAIFLVIALHCTQRVSLELPFLQYIGQNGGKGVQLFYIVSALTLTMSWFSRSEANPAYFYIRRFFRIAPLFYIAILFYALSGDRGPQYWAPEGIQAWQIGLTALFLHGFHPYAINSVVPGGWSIAVEVLFYALYPWLIPYCSSLRKSLLVFGASVLLFYIARPLLIAWMSPHFPASSQYLVSDFPYRSILGQLPTFIFGICVYHLIKKGRKFSIVAGSIAAAFGLVVLVGAYVADAAALKKMAENPFLSVFYLSGMVLLASAFNWKSKIFEYLGKVSYGGYLSNLAVIGLLGAPVVQDSLSLLPGHGFLFLMLALVAVTLVSQLLHQFIELPGMNQGKRVIANLKRSQS